MRLSRGDSCEVVALDVSGRFLAADEGLDGSAGFLRRGPVAKMSKKQSHTLTMHPQGQE